MVETVMPTVCVINCWPHFWALTVAKMALKQYSKGISRSKGGSGKELREGGREGEVLPLLCFYFHAGLGC